VKLNRVVSDCFRGKRIQYAAFLILETDQGTPSGYDF
jgi:hypothetical protein